MRPATQRKADKVAAIALCSAAVVVAVALFAYCDGNLHGEQRMIDRAFDAGFTEKQVTVDGATVNYAEGPDSGPALLLVHG